MSALARARFAASAPSLYERWGDRLTDWCPYVTLAVSSVLVLAWSNDTAGERLADGRRWS